MASKMDRSELYWACQTGNIKLFKSSLFENNVDINEQEENGLTFLHYACAERNNENHNPKSKFWKSLHDACAPKREKIVYLLLNNKADPNKQDKFGSTPLHDACYEENENIVSLLLNNNADPNKQDKFGYTPLHCAFYAGHGKIISLLIRNGADMNIKDKLSLTPDENNKTKHEEIVLNIN